MKELLVENSNALIIVAHPDDETIWMGGTIMKNKKTRWSIFSLCRADDSDRAPKFKNACKKFGARPFMAAVEDDEQMNIQQSIPIIENEIRKKFSGEYFDCIFTHGANGEYGHPRHKGAHRAVKQLVKNGTLRCGRLIFFSYKTDKDGKIKNSLSPNSLHTNLLEKETKQKKDIIQRLYGFRKNSFESVSCLPKETFISQLL